jgi:hypothetical protein
MTPRDIVRELRRIPFVPFRLTLTEGSTYDIKHPELCLVTRRSVYIGVDPATDNIAEDSVLIDVDHVVKLDPIPKSAKGKKS